MCIINVFSLPRNRKKSRGKPSERALLNLCYKHYNYITGIMNVDLSSILIIIWLEAMYSCDPAVQLITYHDTCTTVWSIPSLH